MSRNWKETFLMFLTNFSCSTDFILTTLGFLSKKGRAQKLYPSRQRREFSLMRYSHQGFPEISNSQRLLKHFMTQRNFKAKISQFLGFGVLETHHYQSRCNNYCISITFLYVFSLQTVFEVNYTRNNIILSLVNALVESNLCCSSL